MHCTAAYPMQCARHFLILDNSTGIQLFTYEGRQLCNPKFQGLRTELLNREMVSLSNDTIAVLDQQVGLHASNYFHMCSPLLRL